MRLGDIPAPQQTEERERARRRGRALQLGIGVLFLTLLGRLWFLQVAQGDDMRRASEMNRLRKERKAAPRGEIRDRAGVLLAGTRPKFVVSINRDQFKTEGPEGRRLAGCLNMPLEELAARAREAGPNFQRVRVAVDIDQTTLARLSEMRPWLPGVSIDLEELRYYPLGAVGAHLLGYIGPIGQKQYEEHKDIYAPDARVGRTGLEKVYQDHLRGMDGGLVIEVDAAGRRTRLVREDVPVRGADLGLSVDAAVQRAAEEGLKGKTGSAVAIDPSTGEVLALASQPAYDPNLFARGIRVAEWGAIMSDKRLPLMNRAVQSVYPPGSTFKLVTALAGLRAGAISASSGVRCTGAVYLGRHRFRCWVRQGHGYVDFFGAIAKSCDVFFYRVGRSVGVDAIHDMAVKFGLGARTGIDTTGEQPGTVPSVEWKRTHVPKDPSWHPGETLNAAIGQGYMQASSLQIAMMAGAVAMHGKVYRPHIVRTISSDGKSQRIPPQLLRQVDVPDAHCELVVEGMRRTVESGTGRAAALPGITVGGKTGCAETSGAAHAWFVCVAPLEKPRIAVCVMVEHGRHGATAAAPVARAMMAAYFKVKTGAPVRASGD